MNHCRHTPKNNYCGGAATVGRDYEPFRLCLPFGGALAYDGYGFTYQPGQAPKDGVYGLIELRGGCLTGLREPEVPTYTPPPCSPAPRPCDEGPTAAPSLAIRADNLLSLDLAGRLLAKLFLADSDTVKLRGTGVEDDPLMVEAVIPETKLRLDTLSPEALPLRGAGTEADPYQIRHAEPDSLPLTLGGFKVDKYGHVQSYSAPAEPGIKEIQGVRGVVDVLKEAQYPGVAVVTLPRMFETSGSFSLGGFIVQVDVYGRVTGFGEDPAGGAETTVWRKLFEGSRAAMTYQFTTRFTGSFSFSYVGDLGLAAAGVGLAALPAGVGLSLDGQSLSGLARLDNGKAAGFEAQATLSAGEHNLQITLPAAVTAPGLLQVIPCRT